MKTVVTLLFAVLLFTAPAWAVLGQPVESVQSDQRALEGQLHSANLPGFSIHQISRDDGNIVREFFRNNGDTT